MQINTKINFNTIPICSDTHELLLGLTIEIDETMKSKCKSIFNIFAHQIEMPKKIFTILFISLIAFSQIGYYLIIHQARQEHKGSIRKLLHQNISEHLLTAIDYTANKNVIYWEEEGKEFFFNGEIYDLVKTKNVAGRLYLYCINDEKENELIVQYNGRIKNNSSTERNIKSTFDNSFSPYLIVNFAIIYPQKDFDKKYSLTFSKIESSGIKPALKPPQELFV